MPSSASTLAKSLVCVAALTSIPLLALSACDQKTPAPSTLSLLTAGDARACSTADIHKLLQSMLVPQETHDDDAAAASAYLQARKSLTFSFDTTTVDTVDSATHAMVCSTSATAAIGSTTSGAQRIAYKIQPTTDGDASIALILPSDDDSAKTAMLGVVVTEATRIARATPPTAGLASSNVEPDTPDNDPSMRTDSAAPANADANTTGEDDASPDQAPPAPPPPPPR